MNWDFKLHDTRYLTHGFHTYPAKMIPQIADKLLTEFGKNAKILFDPFCGTGTSLVEAKLRNVNSIGFDLNPLALLIAKVKTTPIEEKTLRLYLENFHKYYFEILLSKVKREEILPPKYENIDYWFSKKVQKDLTHLRHYINEYIDNEMVSDFFKVAFSQTIRDCSWTRNDEFKLYRMPEDKIKLFNPDVFTVFEQILSRNYQSLIEFNKEAKNEADVSTYNFNSTYSIPQKYIKNDSVDIVVTSPPYGDSSTTVAYGQFSAMANQWIFGMEKPRALDKKLMGGNKAKYISKFISDILNQQISEISKIDRKRALDVTSFYREYQKSINNISSTIKKGGFSCFVVSNRTVRGVNLNTDKITIDFFKECGLNHVETFERKILNKRLPKHNSPNGKNGNKNSLMNMEYVIIMQK